MGEPAKHKPSCWKCLKCQLPFATESKLTKHKPGCWIKCPKCQAMFATESELAKHKPTCWKCLKCQAPFATESNLTKQKKRCWFKCNNKKQRRCGRLLVKTQAELTAHNKRCHKEKCYGCGATIGLKS